MMGGVGAGFSFILFLYALLALGLTLGFSYIIWVLAQKETGYVKTFGLVIAIGTAILAVILFLFGLTYGSRFMGMRGGMMGPGRYLEEKEGRQMMEKMMERMMKEYPRHERK